MTVNGMIQMHDRLMLEIERVTGASFGEVDFKVFSKHEDGVTLWEVNDVPFRMYPESVIKIIITKEVPKRLNVQEKFLRESLRLPNSLWELILKKENNKELVDFVEYEYGLSDFIDDAIKKFGVGSFFTNHMEMDIDGETCFLIEGNEILKMK